MQPAMLSMLVFLALMPACGPSGKETRTAGDEFAKDHTVLADWVDDDIRRMIVVEEEHWLVQYFVDTYPRLEVRRELAIDLARSEGSCRWVRSAGDPGITMDDRPYQAPGTAGYTLPNQRRPPDPSGERDMGQRVYCERFKNTRLFQVALSRGWTPPASPESSTTQAR